jgi:hypothetical protein
MFGKKWALLANNAAFIPRRTRGAKGGKYFDGHDFSPAHQTHHVLGHTDRTA